MDREAWDAAVHGVRRSRTQLMTELSWTEWTSHFQAVYNFNWILSLTLRFLLTYTPGDINLDKWTIPIIAKIQEQTLGALICLNDPIKKKKGRLQMDMTLRNQWNKWGGEWVDKDPLIHFRCQRVTIYFFVGPQCVICSLQNWDLIINSQNHY